ncbi:Tar ligand binding domain-containing protein, partial [Rhodoferax sp.]|uniref:Tar ligand binding domain-containing protein n=1 Tax=Rhodoferax sp. TaxID=50421 RepID=UPI0026311524
MNLNNMKIGTRLTLLLGVLSALLLLVGGWGMVTLAKANDAMEALYQEHLLPAHQLDEINYYMIRN